MSTPASSRSEITAEISLHVGARSVRLELPPDEDSSLDGVFGQLIGSEGGLSLDLRISNGDWQMSERFHDGRKARRRLAELRQLAANPSLVSLPMRACPVPLEQDRWSRLSEAFRALIRHDQVLSGNLVNELHRIGVWDRAIIMTPDRLERFLIYRHIGSGYAERFGPAWAGRALGQRHDFQDHPDSRYTDWATGAYSRAFLRQEPLRQFIDAVIPSFRGARLPARVNYDRLLMPIRLLDGGPALLFCSQTVSGLLALAPALEQPGLVPPN